MNVSTAGQRPRGPPNGLGPGGRPVQDHRNGSNISAMSSASANDSRNRSGSEMSRAETFEDEKKRIIESSFAKKEADGSASESYITHIRIVEDAAYPSSPPPLESPPDNKKARVIIVAVKRSGRVRMHKARENANGTFSIGKTWVLDDLEVIESFTNAVPQTAEQQQNKSRAGPTGFIVTVQKPYYWKANTAKEKDFFIFSLIKIYRKYTGGKLPQLIGFSSQELDQLSGTSGPQNGAPTAARPNAPAGESVRVPSQEPSVIREPPVETSRERRQRPSQERPSQERPSQERPSQERPPEERVLHSAVAQTRSVRSAGSNERIHMPGAFPSTDSIQDPSPQSSQHQLKTNRSESPALRNAVPQPKFSRPSAGQSTDSFQSGRETQPAPLQPSGRSSNERVGQNGTYATGVTPGPDRPTIAQDRPVNAVKDIPTPVPHAKEATPAKQAIALNFNPGLNDNSPDQATTPKGSLDLRNGNMRDHSMPGRDSSQGTRGLPSLNQSESSEDNFPNETRSTTASSHVAQSSQTTNQEVKSLEPAAHDDGISTPQPSVTKFPPTPPPETPTEEEHRPGLGPMIKKKKSTTEVASKFRKAATAYNAFKPRAGGAAERVANDKTAGGDGITGVFQAPSLLKGISQDDVRPATPKQSLENRPSTPDVKREIPTVQITTSPAKPVTPVPPEPVPQKPSELVLQKSSEYEQRPPIAEKAQEDRRKKHRSDHSAKYAKTLGINAGLLEGRTFEIEEVLNDFGWGEEGSGRATFEELEKGIRKEIARVEAGSWLSAVENNDERVVAVAEMMDRVVAECDELDNLLTLYNVELGILSEDVAYIEAQSQGLQVQTANQKLLQNELKNLLDTVSISTADLSKLKNNSLSTTREVQEVEYTLAQLYAAMLTIDPKLRHNDSKSVSVDQASLHRSSSTGHGSTELSSMHAVREKKETFRRESVDFIQRLKRHMSKMFQDVEQQTKDALESNRNNKVSANPTKLDHHLRDAPKQDLWLYSPLILFAREMEMSEWEDLLRMYESRIKTQYQGEFGDNFSAWKRTTRKQFGDEQDVLFTTQEKENESLVGRKLTVKRSKTVRAGDRISSGDKTRDGKVTAYEAFAGALTETARVIFVEQNFVVDLFHASSLDTQDFIDAHAIEPAQRKTGDLMVKKPFDPDRNMAKTVSGVMEEIYSFWPTELQSLADWTIKQDAMNGVGVLFALESQLLEVEETNQEFLTQAVTRIRDRLVTKFAHFINEQIRGIEDTKVKIKKRKGVIAFMKTFPNFSIALENMLPPTRSLDHLPVRATVNDAYNRINKAMFESLKFIAKESPTATQTAATAGDPEDKEALNYHILLIENMNHYIEEVAVRKNPVLEDWNFRARAELNEHMELYLAAVIRRPLGKLLDFLESTESLIRNNPGSPTSIATRASHSRSTFKKILSSYDAKEIKRGIDTLKKRVDKHFGDGDDTAGLSRELVTKVFRECEGRYLQIGERVSKVVKDVYESSLEVEWRREDVVSAFRR
ncbi:hypothetical protein HO173_003880 [Letharia columbiana]|uniref:Exocyst complex component Sec3 PIP2-binding N-terminal domain-containing protein n=1 Tax=Letharia columbiana TaxID=112416 RepID=A0A8H6FZH1_9LECA|nr:uncharacterized protein HO173_003880 [Letharia columbiana]KAF6237679.1 hypothetical protein HO173_003880 [Letharia columbiana]